MGASTVALLVTGLCIGVTPPPTQWSVEAAGQVQVLDGALLSIRGQRVRPADVAAPAQRCDAGRAFVACGVAAAQVMRGLVGAGPVRCRIERVEVLPWARSEPVWVGVCEVRGVDLGAGLVQAGFGGPAARSAYASDGLSACVARLGLWAWSVESPWTFAMRREGEDIRPVFIRARSRTPRLRALGPPRSAEVSGPGVWGERRN